MGAQKARLILAMRQENVPHGNTYVILKDKETGVVNVDVPLTALPKPELLRAARIVGALDSLKARGVTHLAATLDQLRDETIIGLRERFGGEYSWDGHTRIADVVKPVTPFTIPDTFAESSDKDEETRQAWENAATSAPMMPQEMIDAAKVKETKETPAESPANDLAAMLTSMVHAAAASSISEEKVRAIIADEVKALAPNVTTVHCKTGEVREIEGTVHEAFDKVTRVVSLGQHAYLPGPAGTGKTTLAQHVAETLNLKFFSMSCHSQMTATSIFGYMNASGNYVDTLFRVAYDAEIDLGVNDKGEPWSGALFLFDEMDAGNANVQAALNQALANGHCAFPDRMVNKRPMFVCLAAANTYGTGATTEYVGRNVLDAATLDRFTMIEVAIDRNIERARILAHLDTATAEKWLARIEKYRENVKAHGLKVIISPRATIFGAELLAAGFTEREAIEMRVLRGLSDDVRRKIEA